MKQSYFKILVILSVLCYVAAHVFPVFSLYEDEPYNYFQGIWMNLLGWLTVVYFGEGRIEFFIWCANPIYILTMIFLTIEICFKRQKYYPSKFTIALPFIATVLGLLYYWTRGVAVNEGGSLCHIETLYIGYWLWVASFALLALSLYVRKYGREG